MDVNIDQANYNYNMYIPAGLNLADYWQAVMLGEGANTQTQGFENLAVYLAPFMPYYETITPGYQNP